MHTHTHVYVYKYVRVSTYLHAVYACECLLRGAESNGEVLRVFRLVFFSSSVAGEGLQGPQAAGRGCLPVDVVELLRARHLERPSFSLHRRSPKDSLGVACLLHPPPRQHGQTGHHALPSKENDRRGRSLSLSLSCGGCRPACGTPHVQKEILAHHVSSPFRSVIAKEEIRREAECQQGVSIDYPLTSMPSGHLQTRTPMESESQMKGGPSPHAKAVRSTPHSAPCRVERQLFLPLCMQTHRDEGAQARARLRRISRSLSLCRHSVYTHHRLAVADRPFRERSPRTVVLRLAYFVFSAKGPAPSS